jgi:hypothetical protein
MHQMRISTTQVSSVMLRSKKVCGEKFHEVLFVVLAGQKNSHV